MAAAFHKSNYNFKRITAMDRKKITAVVAMVMLAFAVVNAAWGGKTVELKEGDAPVRDNTPKIALAYVVSASKTIPDPDVFTHLIYAFAEFNDSCDGVVVDNPGKLRGMAALKEKNPDLKVILGVGGYKRKGFSEMAGDKKKRKAFVKNVKSILKDYGLDGVDLDWEFPTTELGGHTAAPDDDKNYVKVVRDLRKALGKDKWISFYSNNSAAFIDLKRMAPYVSYVNVSGYNLTVPKEGERGGHQSPLYPSAKLGGWCVKSVVARHLEKGVPPEKLLIGIPFFGRGITPFPTYTECPLIAKYAGDLKPLWDDDAKAPYYADADGNPVLGFDDERSIEAKMDFVRANFLPGVFVWNYDGDFPDRRLSDTLRRLRK